MKGQFKVRERFDAEALGVEDRHYDRVTFFDTPTSADNYYYTVVGRNYYTDLWEYNGEKWVCIDSKCHSHLLK